MVRRALMVIALAGLALTGVLGFTAPASAEDPRVVTDRGLTATGGILVDPAGRLWVSDARKGFCRLSGPSATESGSIEPTTCLGGDSGRKGPALPGAPTLLDPTDGAPASGDEIALIPDVAQGSAKLVRARWSPATGVFAYADRLTMFGRDVRPIAASTGPDQNVYVVFARARSIVRILSPASPQPRIETVGFTAASAALAVAAGPKDSSGRVILYVADTTALTQLAAPAGSGSGAATASYSVGRPARLHFDQTTRMLYAGSASATALGGDAISRVDTATGQVIAKWATGFTRIGGITARGSLVLAADDEGLVKNPAQVGVGAAYRIGDVLPVITAGPTAASGAASADPAFTDDATPTFRIDISNDAALRCAFDNVDWAACAKGDVTSPRALADGVHRFGVRAGSTGTVVERVFTVDTVAPAQPIVIAPANNAIVGRTVPLTVTAEAGAVLRCAVDPLPASPGDVCTSGQALVMASEGPHTIRVTATDRAGNTSGAASVNVTVELTAPTPRITEPSEDGRTFTGTAAFAFDAGGATATFRCRVDAVAFQACTSPVSVTGLAGGAHTFTVEASDAVGNASSVSRTFQFVVADTTAPTVTASPAAGAFPSGQQISLTASEPATIHFTSDGSTPTPASPVYSAPLTLTANLTLKYFAVDAAGNTSAVSTQTYTLRTAPPPSGAPHDFNADGFNDVLARDASGGLWVYRGNGSGLWLSGARVITGLSDVDMIMTPGDWSGDGYPDMLGRSTGGELRLYKGDGSGGFAAPIVIATGWASITAALSPGDWNGDGKPDLLARTSGGDLDLHPGDGAGGIGGPVRVGSGWQVMTAILSPGDWNGDGKSDVLARNGAGALLLYPGNGSGGWGAVKQVGSGWNGMTAVFSPRDWNGDGKTDVLARDTAGNLLLYPGNGSGGWGVMRQVGTGWGGMAVLG